MASFDEIKLNKTPIKCTLNELHPKLDLSGMVMGKSSARKKTRRHGVLMNDDGSCPIDGCSYICKSMKKSTFAMHVTRKHQTVSGNSKMTYTCETCFRTFSSRSIMNNHQQTAHSEWKFVCKEPNCGKVCPNKAGLLLHHMKKHMNMKDSDCVDENGCCLNCAKQLPRTGHSYHYARCIGLDRTLLN